MTSSRRDLVRMEPAEVEMFLQDHSTLVVASLQADGRPHMVTVSYAIVDGKIAFTTYPGSQKAVNMRRDSRVSCLIEEYGHGYSQIRGVMLVATARLIENPEYVLRVMEANYRSMASKAWSTPISTTEEFSRMAKKRVAVQLDIIDTISWNHAHLEGKY